VADRALKGRLAASAAVVQYGAVGAARSAGFTMLLGYRCLGWSGEAME